MKRILALVIILLSFFCPKAKAQKDTTIEYLDSGYQKTSKQKAFYGRISVRKDKMYLVAMVKMKDGSKVYTGSYKDRSLTGAEGLFEFYTNSVVTMRGYYHEGMQVGTWKSWDTTGLLRIVDDLPAMVAGIDQEQVVAAAAPVRQLAAHVIGVAARRLQAGKSGAYLRQRIDAACTCQQQAFDSLHLRGRECHLILPTCARRP